MSYPIVAFLSNLSLRRGAALLLLILAVLIGGAWVTIDVAAKRVLNRDAGETAARWANFLSANVTDLGQIAAGEQPSSQSLVFLEAALKTGQVFRYVIYNREGFSQLVADADGISSVNVSARSREAADAIVTGVPVVDVKSAAASQNMPQHYSEAYVPVRVGDQPVAIVGAFVDETARYANFYAGMLWASVALCGLIALAFSIPAIAWYRRGGEKLRADRRIQFLAHHDVLTGLANRARVSERLQAALAALPSSGARVAVHYIDVDFFKQVNDMLGHDAGDFLLKTIGERLRTMTRIEDMVARLGGDEFVVVQTGVGGKQQARDFAKRIVTVLGAPMTFGGQELRVTCTIGVALGPADGSTPERLIKSADLALYNGKAGGRNCIRFFAPEMDDAMQRRIALERLVRNAVTHNRFEVHYQPVFEMSRNRLVGFEALVRLRAPDGTFIPPATFVTVAEELQLIDRIWKRTLNEACRAAKSWPQTLTVAVNLSSAQFQTGNVEDAVTAALNKSGLDPRRLEVEISESLLLRNDAATTAALKGLKAMGVSIVVDDFGASYASLRYLSKFPFDKIKIDRGFLESSRKSGHRVETVVKSIIALGREMDVQTATAGAGTVEQVDFLYNAEADQIQGFYFGKPRSAAEIRSDVIGAASNAHAPAEDGRVQPIKKSA